jgi:hypothetical protein
MQVLASFKIPMTDTSSQPTPEPSRSSAGRFCVLVSSSDHGRDVFEIVFQNAETIWRDCDWPRYVGFTRKHPDRYGFKALAAAKPSDWRGELCDQLNSLPIQIEYVLLILEDALFLAPVSGAKLNAIADLIVHENLYYVSLLPVRRNLPGRVIEYFRRKLSKHLLRRLSPAEPYYSSIGITIWKRHYLKWFLQQPGSIWDLEHIVSGKPHYAVWSPVFKQEHLVKKGKWVAQAPRFLAQQGIIFSSEKRGFRPFWVRLRDIREMIVFQTVGFLSFRVRRRLNMISHRAPLQDIYKTPLTGDHE